MATRAIRALFAALLLFATTSLGQTAAAAPTSLNGERLQQSSSESWSTATCDPAGISTIEFEPGAVSDLNALLERLAPRHAEYRHHLRWGDDNGSSHVRAALVGPSITVPFVDRALCLGTWQQIVLLEFDTQARRRELVVQILGE